jgi:hypothetical protein
MSRTLPSLFTTCQTLNYILPIYGTFSGIRTGSLGAGSVGVGVGSGTTTGLGIVSGISIGSEPG